MRSLGWAHIQYDWCPHKKRRFEHQDARRAGHVRTRPPSAGQGERPRKEPALPTACSNTCSPRTAEKHIPVGEATQSVIFCDSSLANCPLLATHSHTHTHNWRWEILLSKRKGRKGVKAGFVCVRGCDGKSSSQKATFYLFTSWVSLVAFWTYQEGR